MHTFGVIARWAMLLIIFAALAIAIVAFVFLPAWNTLTAPRAAVAGQPNPVVVQQPSPRQLQPGQDSPAYVSTPVSQSSSFQATSVCMLDKISTINEVANAGPQRIEVGGGGTQHVDYYPNRGIKSVSYIVPPQRPMIWTGFGSIWEGNGLNCQSFNYVADATQYAQGRLGNGHSGLVVDFRTNTVVANVANMSNQDIKALLAIHMQSQSGMPTIATAASTGGSQSVQGCSPAEEKTLVSPTDLAVKGPAIVHPWWNNGKPSFGQQQVKVKIGSGESATFIGMMGKAYVYQDVQACQANLDKELANASFSAKTLAELRGEGLVR